MELESLVRDSWKGVTAPDATLTVHTSATIIADPDRLRHLFENLFRNSVEHAGLDVTVRVGVAEDGFYIEDDGSGISETERDDVFGVDYSTSEDGVGFGLSIVKQVVEAHGWKIRITEGSDGGARFEVAGVEFADE